MVMTFGEELRKMIDAQNLKIKRTMPEVKKGKD
jgi:hypothetical protein